jgi:hypothetical protein
MNQNAAPLDAKQIVASAWQDQAIWSETANRLKTELFSWRGRAAVAGVLGAFLETLAASLSGLDGKWAWLPATIAILGAISLAFVPYVARTRASKDKVGEWVRARSASEALKETIYRYLVKATTVAAESSPADLIRSCQAIKDKVQDLYRHAATVEAAPKERPLTLTVDEYIDKRVNDQIEGYYRPKGRKNALAARRLHNVEFYLGLAAVVVGAVAGGAAARGLQELSALGPWVAVITTAGAAVTAHLAASRYDHQAMTYYGTADRLTGLRDEWLASPDRLAPARVAKLVDDSEHAISTENEAWLVGWTQKEA